MEWSFEDAVGVVTVRREGDHAFCQAIRPDGSGGLYKAWLNGQTGRALLGTLIPEGGALRLRRSMPVSQLERQGAWPPTGAEILPAIVSQHTDAAPSGWCWTNCPARLMGERTLAQALKGLDRALLRRDGEGFTLAFPYRPDRPFPLPALFCLSRLERLGERWHVLFRFSRRGCPELAHDSPQGGDTTSGI